MNGPERFGKVRITENGRRTGGAVHIDELKTNAPNHINHLNTEFHPTFVADISFCFVTAILIIAPLAVTGIRGQPQA